jgi:hypothetical protein
LPIILRQVVAVTSSAPASLCLSLAATATQTFSFVPRRSTQKKDKKTSRRRQQSNKESPRNRRSHQILASDPRFPYSRRSLGSPGCRTSSSPPAIVLPRPGPGESKRSGSTPKVIACRSSCPCFSPSLVLLVAPRLLVCLPSCCLFFGFGCARTVVC